MQQWKASVVLATGRAGRMTCFPAGTRKRDKRLLGFVCWNGEGASASAHQDGRE